MRPQPLRLRSLVEICNMDHQYLEALMLDKRILVLTKIPHQLLLFLRVELVTDPLRQQLQQCDNPKGQFLVLHLQHQQLEQVSLDDVVVSEDKSRLWIYWRIVTDQSHQIPYRLLAVRPLDVRVEHLLVSLHRPHRAQALHVEDDLIFELPLLVLVVLVDHQLEVLVLPQVSTLVLELFHLLHDWRYLLNQYEARLISTLIYIKE